MANPFTKILLLANIGRSLLYNAVTGKLDVTFSTNAGQLLKYGTDNNLLLSSADVSAAVLPAVGSAQNGYVYQVAGGVIAAAPLGGDFEVSRVVAITASGTNVACPTPTATEVAWFIEACGGGASGAAQTGSATVWSSAGGHPGTLVRTETYPISALPATLDSVVIGAGGASVTASGSVGNSGGTTTVTIGGVQVVWAPGGFAMTTNSSNYTVHQCPGWTTGGRAPWGIQFVQSMPGPRNTNASGAASASAPTVGYGPGAGANTSYSTSFSGAPGIGSSARIGGVFQNYQTAGGVSSAGAGGNGSSASAASLQYGGGGASGNGAAGGNGGFPGGGGGASGSNNTGTTNQTAASSGSGGAGVVRIVLLQRIS